MTKQDVCLPSCLDRSADRSDALALRGVLQSQCDATDSARRLIVLIPAGSDHASETRRIWKLADATGARVLLLGLCKALAEEPGLRRQLVTMAALMGNGRVSAETRTEVGTSWVNAVKSSYQAGDRIVCFAEHREGVLNRPMQQILEAKLNVSVYVLSEPRPQGSRPRGPGRIIPWPGSIVIIAGFGILQARIAQLPSDWFQTVLFILSTLFEFWLIWVWNSLFG